MSLIKQTQMKPDLKHRDWLLFSQKKLIQLGAPNATVEIINTIDGGKRLIIENVIESELSALKFLTNTDRNNNYLYLESMTLRLNDANKDIEIPGMSEILINIFQLSDINSFLNDSKTHTPFSNSAFNGESVGIFVDRLTEQLPFGPKTNNKVKYFSLVLNPDEVWDKIYVSRL